MVLILTLYMTRVRAREFVEQKENIMMMQEDYRIPLFVGEDGIVLVIGEKPSLVIAEEYQDRCRIEIFKKNTESNNGVFVWLWEWLNYIE
jgi:hypothetical protein